MHMRLGSNLILCLLLPLALGALVPEKRELTPLRSGDVTGALSTHAGFTMLVAEIPVSLRVMAIPVLPGEEVEIRARGRTDGGALTVESGEGSLRADGTSRWVWKAPGHLGAVAVRIVHAPADTMDLSFLVQLPSTRVEAGQLNGYAIGSYLPPPEGMPTGYDAPRGFVEVRPMDEDILVSPHFTLGQFLCKQPGDPRYVVLSVALVEKLEAILSAANDSGLGVSTLAVMSGFRTPAYNRAIGNVTDFSRHLWGDAADIFIDEDRDGEMDDMNDDGRIDFNDAQVLAEVVERVEQRTAVRPGGLAVYRKNGAHGPFVHVDARGHRARW